MEEKPIKKVKKKNANWYHFQIISPTQAILRGNYSIIDKRFKIMSRGRQASAASVVSVIYVHLLEVQDWTSNLIDKVLEDGDRLFRVSQARNRLKDGVYMTPSLLEKQFFVGDYKCQICMKVGTICGNVASETADGPSLKTGLRKFLDSMNFGILTSQEMSVAIWNRQNCGNFYFDPAPVDEQGQRNPSGNACIIRVTDVDKIFYLFVGNLKNKIDSKYIIDQISVTKIEAIERKSCALANVNPFTVKKKETTGIVVQKTNCNNHDAIMDISLEKTKNLQELIRKIPLSIEMTNTEIKSKFIQDPMVDQNLLDDRYTYEEVKVNVPSTFITVASDPERKILHGWTSDTTDIYKARGINRVANSVMAIVMKKIHPARTWLRQTLDEILTMGDAIYKQIKDGKPSMQVMTAIELNDIGFKFEDNKFIIDVDLLTIVGTVISKDPTVLNLAQGLREFFITNTDGVLEVSTMALSIWIEENYYYLFDSQACDISGLHMTMLEKEKSNETVELTQNNVIGKSCVIRFKNLNSLHEHLLKNLESTHFNCRYTIRRVEVVNDMPGTRSWNYFKPGIAGKSWILQGNINSENEAFHEHSRGVQSIGISVTTLIAAKYIAPSKWSKHDVDTAIYEGDSYYNWCYPPAGELDDERKIFAVTNLKKYLYYKKCKVYIDIKESCVIGDLSNSMNDNSKNLDYVLSNFFSKYQFGILEFNNKYFPIWKFEELTDGNNEVAYYLFCDKPWKSFFEENEEESKNLKDSACLLKFLNIAEIIFTLQDQLIIEDENSKLLFFIHEIKVISMSEQLTDEEIEIDKTTPILPELRAYTAVNDNGAFLCGSFNQANEKNFKIETRNKQQAANALIALAMTKLFDPHLWYVGVLDDILMMGDKLSDECSKNMLDLNEDDSERKRQYLLPSEVNQSFLLGINQITLNIEEVADVGQLNDLTKNLETFFSSHKMGVFRQNESMLAIWKEENVYFTMDPRGQKTGNATVYWFIDISSLAEILIECCEKLDGDFFIDGVTVENNYSVSEQIQEDLVTEDKWYNFSKVDKGIWRIDSSIITTDDMFVKENQGNQSAAVCIMAIVFSKVYEPRYWSTEILDEITITGDRLHSRSALRLGENKSFQSNEIISEFFICNRKIAINILDCVQFGTIKGQSPKLKDIKTGISKFFEKSSSGCVVLSNSINLGIWTYDNYFYLFKPGYYLMRFENKDKLSEEMITNVDKNADFGINSVDVSDWNKLPPWTYDPSSAVRPSNLPPLNAYCRLPGGARAILRGSTHQASEVFPEGIRDSQTAANCIICLGMYILKNPITWTRKILDEILAIGINLHRESLKCTIKTTTLEPKDIIRIFRIGVNVLTADIEKDTVSGIVTNPPAVPAKEDKYGKKSKATKDKHAKDKKSHKIVRVSPPQSPPILLKEGLETFFANNKAGILVIGRYMIAIWTDSGVYFMYDPRPRNREGLKHKDISEKTSCVVWFACIQPLYDLLFINLSDDEKIAKFSICRVIIKTVCVQPLPSPIQYKSVASKEQKTRTEVEDLFCPSSPFKQQLQPLLNMDFENRFEWIDYESSILIGNCHMSDVCFCVKNRGLQSTAIAAVAVVIAALHAPSTWASGLVDATIKFGDALHTECSRISRSSLRTLSPSELLEVFVVGDVRARIHVLRNITAGITLEHDLASALELFFTNNSFGIMYTVNYSIPLMKHWGKFYFLDPSKRNGFRGSFNSAGCLVKCESIAKLAKIVLKVCTFKEPISYTLNGVQVIDLHFFTR